MSTDATATTATAQQSSPSLVLHHLNNSRSQRILWLLEELEVPYEIKKYERLPSQLAPKELAAIHPLGKAPIITDGVVTVAESGAIVEYIISKYGKGKAQPPESGWVDNLYYTHYAEGTLQPLLTWRYILSLVPDRAPLLVRPFARAICNTVIGFINTQLKSNFEMIDKHMDKVAGHFLAGGDEPTSADFMMLFGLETLTSRQGGDAPASVKEYISMVHARPAYKRALEKGGEYDYYYEAA